MEALSVLLVRFRTLILTKVFSLPSSEYESIAIKWNLSSKEYNLSFKTDIECEVVAQLVECRLYKHQELSSDSQHLKR